MIKIIRGEHIDEDHPVILRAAGLLVYDLRQD
jgi:hypothetical protein